MQVATKQNKKKKGIEFKLIPRRADNPNKFKSVEIYMLKKNAEEIALKIKNCGHLLKADDPAVKYAYEQSVKLAGAVHHLISGVAEKKC